VNIGVTYCLDAEKTVLLAENCSGMGLEKGSEGA